MGRKSQFRNYLFKLFFHYIGNKDAFTRLVAGEDILMCDEDQLSFYSSFIEEDEEHPLNNVDNDLKLIAESMVKSSFENFEQRSKTIEEVTQGRKISQIATIELSILLSALEESLTMPETPKKVIVNEYVILTKDYSSKDSYSFINAVLDKILKND